MYMRARCRGERRMPRDGGIRYALLLLSRRHAARAAVFPPPRPSYEVRALARLRPATGLDGFDDLEGSDAFSSRHCTAAPFFNSAGQLTITVSNWPACAGVARTRKRWPS